MIRRAALALVLLGVLAGCRVDVTVELTMDDDGTGELAVTAVADGDVVEQAPGLAEDLRFDDAVGTGWLVEGPTTTEDGGLTVTLSHPVTSAEEATTLLASIGPPFADMRLERTTSADGDDTTVVLSGQLELPDGFDSFADSDLVAAVGGSPFADDLAAAEATPAESMSVVFRAHLPGEVQETNARQDDAALVWEAPLDGTATAVTARAVQRPSSGGWTVVSRIALVLLVLWIVASAALIVSVARARSRRARARRRRLARGGVNLRSADYVQSLARGLAVIRAFDGEHPALTLSEVSRRAGLSRATARRFLLTLVELGYVHTDGREFSLRPSVLDLGFAYLSSMGLPEVALPHMEALVAALQESSSMSVLDGGDVIYIARVPTRRRIMTVSIAVGTRFPAYATSMGRVLLAHLGAAELDAYLATTTLTQLTPSTVHDVAVLRRVLDGVRERGYAIVDQELEDGLRSAAAPVQADGAVVAAVNVSVHATRASVGDIEERLVPPLLDTVARINADLGTLTRRR